MSFLGRTEIKFYPEVDFKRSTFEPAASTLCQVRGLWGFRNLQSFLVESACFVLTAGWHGELNMIER